ncbi:enoyl-CoA hydratase/isomerase family protein [Chondromyces apiculatus]|uniref:Enoyl-CoA hydratase n=1 Tax=Chondromyces apiculatus DSM 436 TaxID=1192034 RepID=A0A017T5E1_9BACT|nr:enoyl-CoA hydratase/isomerase family protein [Chondromyces apiculatus]EYF04217.1 Enoyl-CoA hydratase [Chondromyces apiculatus DSM 436]
MTLQVEAAGDALILTLHRPDRRHAIDRALARQLGEAIRAASAEPRVRGVVLTASGDDVFVAGGDIREIDQLTRDGSSGAEILGMFEDLAIIEQGDLPVVAAVQGDVFGGGCELLLLCDFVFFEEHASLAFRHAMMGLSPAWGGIARLCERVGSLEATRLLLTACRIDAAEALRIGFVNEVVPRGGARDRAIALVRQLSGIPRTSVSALKHALRGVREAMRGSSPELERAVFAQRWGGPDHRQALDAFLRRK